MIRAATTVRAVLLDMGGTLVDSNDAHARAWVEALAEGGFAIPLMHPAPDRHGRRLSGRQGAIVRARYLTGLRPFPQARDLVARLREDGLRLIVASSSERAMLGALLELVGIVTLIDGTTSASDAAHSKPAPDLVVAALAEAALPAAAAVMLSDTPYDIAAARQLGVGTIAPRCGGFADVDLAGALALYADPADLLARYDTSPLGSVMAGETR
jgi:HAD superfamily hydrolase (TIGR01509 family)